MCLEKITTMANGDIYCDSFLTETIKVNGNGNFKEVHIKKFRYEQSSQDYTRKK